MVFGEGLSSQSEDPAIIQTLPSNGTIDSEDGLANYTHIGTLPWCDSWREPQHILFQLANAFFVISYAAPNNSQGVLFMHAFLIIGFMLFSFWAWNVICAPDVFSWNFTFMFFNMGQLVYIIYQMRPVKFDPELEEAYQTLFYPFKVSRLQFKRMVSPEFAQIMSLHAGEAYAMQDVTHTDRLGLLLSGKVSIIAATACRYLSWQRSSLEYLFVKETYIATVLTTLIAKDITVKLHAMNKKIVTENGSHLDIRLPSITSSLTAASGENKTTPRTLRQSMMVPGTVSPDSDW